MKKLIFLLLLPLFGFGQVATTKNVDSAIIANINTPAAISAINKFTYYGATSAQVTAIINGINAYVTAQIATLPFALPPKSPYTNSAPLSYTGVNGLTISGDSINCGNGACITLNNCSNIHITKSKFQNGASIVGIGITLNNCTGITVDSNLFIKVASGVYAYQGGTNLVVNANQFQNITSSLPRGQAFQGNGISGTGIKITNNRVDNTSISESEDAISLYKANGTQGSHIIISGNWIRGGVSKTGSACMLADAGGSWIDCTSNIIVQSGNIGIGVASGTNINVSNNTIFSSASSISNVGVYVYQQYTTPCNTINLSNNLVYWKNASGTNNGFWNANNCTGVTVTNNNWTDTALNANIMPAKIITYQ